MKRLSSCIALSILLITIAGQTSRAQSTEFTYQGRLLDSSLPPTAVYDFEFALFDAVSGPTQQGATQQILGVQVTNGIFTVKLNFGAQFTGAARFLEIRVKNAPGPFTTLAPRQAITSAPYSVRSLNSTTADTATSATTANNALNLGGVPAADYVVTTDPRMTDARTPTAGSANYIQNQNAGPQSSSNFNISGTGTANIFSAATQYSIGMDRILSNAGNLNLFAGVGAGAVNTGTANSFFGESSGRANATGTANSFFGSGSGRANETGSDNSFFGSASGDSNTTGSFNSFFGNGSGDANTGGSNNSFFGNGSGFRNTGGHFNSFFGALSGRDNEGAINNSFFGHSSGLVNTAGTENSFFGTASGRGNTEGSYNSFFGKLSGLANTTGNNNTIIGTFANVGANNLTNATALGSQALVGASNSLVLGSINGVNGAIADTNVGIGTTTPTQRLHVVGNALFANDLTVSGTLNASLSAGSITSGTLGIARGGTGLSSSGATGNYLRSDGTNWTSSALQPGDIPGGSGSYIQNQNAGAQSSSNFNIDGTGTANIFSATTQYNIGGNRVLSNAGPDNIFAGVGAGQMNSGIGNAFFGTDAGNQNMGGNGNAFFGRDAGNTNTTGFSNTIIGSGANVSANNLNFATALGASAVVTSSSQVQLGRNGLDTVRIGTLAGASATQLCIDANNVLAACSSSARYKENIRPFGLGLGLVKRLQPMSYNWVKSREADLGLIAEEVAAVEPLLVTRNDKGEIQGVKYDQLNVVLINAVNEQQAQIEAQQKEIAEQKAANQKLQAELGALKKLVCGQNTTAEICKP